MTNTRITDAEVFERRYPVILREFSLRAGSGGKGQHSGGDGVIRDIEFRIPVTVSILSERRVYHPYGLEGGEDAQCGLNVWVREVPKPDPRSDATNGTNGVNGINGPPKEHDDEKAHETIYRHINMGGKNTAEMKPGERIIVMTPGGGAWGKVGTQKVVVKRDDHKHAWRKGNVAARQETAEASA
jgi:5-oxoprolinase (ATP-hydrolysing)